MEQCIYRVLKGEFRQEYCTLNKMFLNGKTCDNCDYKLTREKKEE